MPATEDLVGGWQALQQSLAKLPGHGFRINAQDSHVLELRGSGGCRFRSHWQYSYSDAQEPEAGSYYDTQTCAWRVMMADARVDDVTFDAAAVQLELRDGPRHNYATYYVMRLDRRLVLWQSIGEPREGLFIDFMQVPGAR